MKIKVGNTPELKALFEDEEDIMKMLDKVNHALTVEPRNHVIKADQLHFRHQLMVTQGRIRQLQREINS